MSVYDTTTKVSPVLDTTFSPIRFVLRQADGGPSYDGTCGPDGGNKYCRPGSGYECCSQ